jgi:hypothetical protein
MTATETSNYKAIMFAHFNRLQAHQRIVDEAMAERKRLRKLAKADGLNLKELDFMVRCAEAEDDDAVVEELKRRAEIAAWFALPIGYTPDMFADRRPLDEQQEAMGMADGLIGKTLDTARGEHYVRGWQAGQAELAKGIKATDPVDDPFEGDDD